METLNYSALTVTQLTDRLNSSFAVTEAVLMTARKEIENFEGYTAEMEQRARLSSALEISFQDFTRCVSELEQRFKATIPNEF